MYQVLLSADFEHWLVRLKDIGARIKIVARLRSMALGNLGDAKAVGDQVFEARLHFGPGYLLYYVRRGEDVYLLLMGGTKASQDRDIARAKAMAAKLE